MQVIVAIVTSLTSSCIVIRRCGLHYKCIVENMMSVLQVVKGLMNELYFSRMKTSFHA